ncbi:MAG: STAS domain-containing protein [Armatimonadota bacterium]
MIVETIRDTHLTVRAGGDIDISNVHDFDTALRDAVEEAPKGFILDLSGSTYIDSAGLQAIISAYHAMRRVEGKIHIVVKRGNVRDVIHLIHLDALPGILVYEDSESAEQALGKQIANGEVD